MKKCWFLTVCTSFRLYLKRMRNDLKIHRRKRHHRRRHARSVHKIVSCHPNLCYMSECFRLAASPRSQGRPPPPTSPPRTSRHCRRSAPKSRSPAPWPAPCSGRGRPRWVTASARGPWPPCWPRPAAAASTTPGWPTTPRPRRCLTRCRGWASPRPPPRTTWPQVASWGAGGNTSWTILTFVIFWCWSVP